MALTLTELTQVCSKTHLPRTFLGSLLKNAHSKSTECTHQDATDRNFSGKMKASAFLISSRGGCLGKLPLTLP